MLDQETCKWQTDNAVQSATSIFVKRVLSDGSLIKIRVGHEDCWIIMEHTYPGSPTLWCYVAYH